MVTEKKPDNEYFEGDAVSWAGESADGNAAELVVASAGLNARYTAAPGGERIWLHEPAGDQALEITEYGTDGQAIIRTFLHGAGKKVEIEGGREVGIYTARDYGPVTFLRDYPGVTPHTDATRAAASNGGIASSLGPEHEPDC